LLLQFNPAISHDRLPLPPILLTDIVCVNNFLYYIALLSLNILFKKDKNYFTSSVPKHSRYGGNLSCKFTVQVC